VTTSGSKSDCKWEQMLVSTSGHSSDLKSAQNLALMWGSKLALKLEPISGSKSECKWEQRELLHFPAWTEKNFVKNYP